jgi:hypothetical protein
MTSHIAEKWLRLLIRYAMEPIIMFLGIIVINGLVMGLLNGIFAFSICFKCAIGFIFGFPGTVIPLGIGICMPNFVPWGYDNFGGALNLTGLVSVASILNLMIYTSIMKKYVESISGEMMGLLTDTVNTQSLSTHFNDGSGVANAAKSMFAKFTGSDKKSQARRKGVKDAQTNQALSEARGRLSNPNSSSPSANVAAGKPGFALPAPRKPTSMYSKPGYTPPAPRAPTSMYSKPAAASSNVAAGKPGFALPAPRKPTSMYSKPGYTPPAPRAPTSMYSKPAAASSKFTATEKGSQLSQGFKPAQNPLMAKNKNNIVGGTRGDLQNPQKQTLLNRSDVKTSASPVAGSGADNAQHTANVGGNAGASTTSRSVSSSEARREVSNNFSGLTPSKQQEYIDYYRNNKGQFALLPKEVQQQISRASGGTIQAPTGTSLSERVKAKGLGSAPPTAGPLQGTIVQPDQVGKGPVVQSKVTPSDSATRSRGSSLSGNLSEPGDGESGDT